MLPKRFLLSRRVRRSTVLGAAVLVLVSGLIATPARAVVTCDGLPATIEGTNGNDTLTGTIGPDVIAALGGDDIVVGLGGDDRICGGSGDDQVYGEAEMLAPANPLVGQDRIFGDGGSDLLVGDFGSTTIAVAVGTIGADDHIDGGEGADTIAGYGLDLTVTSLTGGVLLNNDTLIGGAGADVMYGEFRDVTWGVVGAVGDSGTGNTIMSGGEGNDKLYGDAETVVGAVAIAGWRDTIDAGNGSDEIYGDTRNGNENIVPIDGGASDDIDGGHEANDTADAGPGTDTCTNVENEANCEA